MFKKNNSEAIASARKLANYRIASSGNFDNFNQTKKTKTPEKGFYNPYLGVPAGFIIEDYKI